MDGSFVARSHPPTLLEWQAAKMRTNMAVECHFPDGMSTVFVINARLCNVRQFCVMTAGCRSNSVSSSLEWSVSHSSAQYPSPFYTQLHVTVSNCSRAAKRLVIWLPRITNESVMTFGLQKR